MFRRLYYQRVLSNLTLVDSRNGTIGLYMTIMIYDVQFYLLYIISATEIDNKLR